jgi:hypothetical protein
METIQIAFGLSAEELEALPFLSAQLLKRLYPEHNLLGKEVRGLMRLLAEGCNSSCEGNAVDSLRAKCCTAAHLNVRLGN